MAAWHEPAVLRRSCRRKRLCAGLRRATTMQRRRSGHQELLLRRRCRLRCHRLGLPGLGVNGVLDVGRKRFRHIGHVRPRARHNSSAVSPYQAIRQDGMHTDQLDRIEGKANAQKDDEAERPAL